MTFAGGLQVCNVAPVPGQTKVWQYVTLMKRVFLIDCPGVVYARDAATRDDAGMVLKGVVRIERLEDASEYIPELLRRVKTDYLVRPPAPPLLHRPECSSGSCIATFVQPAPEPERVARMSWFWDLWCECWMR